MKQTQQEAHFFRYTIFSVLLHAFVVAFFALNFFMPHSQHQVIDNAIRVDIVSLPDKNSNLPAPKRDLKKQSAQPKKPKRQPEPKAAELQPEKTQPKPPAPNPKKRPTGKSPTRKELKDLQDQQSKALDKLAALNKIESEADGDSEQSTAQPVKGNLLSKGSNLSGVARLHFDRYKSKLTHHVNRHWRIPEWLANQELKTQVLIKMDRRGYILKKEIVETSGNRQFDAFVINTIERASPFPQPPDRFLKIAASHGIILGFPE